MSSIIGRLVSFVGGTAHPPPPAAALAPRSVPLGPTPSEKEREQARADYNEYNHLLEPRAIVSELFQKVAAQHQANGGYIVEGKETKKLLKRVCDVGVPLDPKKRRYGKLDCELLLERLKAKISAIDTERGHLLDRVIVAVGKHEKLRGIIPLQSPSAPDSSLKAQMDLLDKLFGYLALLDPINGLYMVSKEMQGPLAEAKQLGFLHQAKEQYTPPEMEALMADIRESYKPLFKRHFGPKDQIITP